MTRSTPRVLHRATFDPKLKVYWVMSSSLVFVASVVGLPLLPFWLLFGWFWWAPRYFGALSCELTERTLVVKRGVVFKLEKTIPLDKIQDLALRHGPLLNAFGLASITIETAGQGGGGTGQGDAGLSGVVDARGFRDRVMAQRDALNERSEGTVAVKAARAGDTPTDPAGTMEVLREIRDTLVRIEGKLPPRAEDSETGRTLFSERQGRESSPCLQHVVSPTDRFESGVPAMRAGFGVGRGAR